MIFKNSLLLIVSLCMANFAMSQTISHVQQFPMEINPGFVGDKEKGRVALLVSRYDYYKRDFSNAKYPSPGFENSYTSAIGYDNIKGKIGYGVQAIGTSWNGRSNNLYFGIKACIAPKYKFKRKNGKGFVISPALDLSLITSNNRFIVTNVFFQNGYYYTFPGRKWEKELSTWPNESKQINLALLYSSAKTKIGIKAGYHVQKIMQRNALKHVKYDLNPYDQSKEEKERESEAVRYTPEQLLDSTNLHTWTEYEWSVYASQQLDFGRRKNFSITIFGYYQKTIRDQVSNPYLYINPNETRILVGAKAKYKKFILGIQPSVIIYKYKVSTPKHPNSIYYAYLLYPYDDYIFGYESERISIIGSFFYLSSKSYEFSYLTTTLSVSYLF